MPADNTDRLVESARQRHELTRSKAVRALRELDRAGTPVNFEVVARNADVSRSWLYTQPDIRAEIERLREATRHSPAPAIPAAQRTSDASLLIRLQAANDHNRLLTRRTSGSVANSPMPSVINEPAVSARAVASKWSNSIALQ